jgi:ureidoglycolate hydrolase
MRARIALSMVVVCLCSTTILSAQDAVKVDPKHYSVVSENDQVRILKAHYGPHEKSVMHSHPIRLQCFLPMPRGHSPFLTERNRTSQSRRAIRN